MYLVRSSNFNVKVKKLRNDGFVNEKKGSIKVEIK
jgi:hypothetical protein